MKRAAFRPGVVLAALSLAAAAFTAPASAAPAAASTGTAVHPAANTPAKAGSATGFWTAENMRSAIPMERLLQPRQVRPADVARGVASIIPQVLPTSGEAWAGGGKVVSTAGRVFFTFNGQKASCSGDAVTSANRSVVVTAGHCVKYQGTWHTDWIFVPGYDNGNAPHGEWAAKSTLTTPQWEASEDINYDVGAAVVGQVDGKSLTDVVGSQGIAFNQERNQDMYAFGYPAADPYDGTKLIYCSGTTFTDFLLSQDHGLSCGMTGGSSGGPWFLNFDEATGAGVQASVNSFGYTFLPGFMFGPYFGADAQALYATAQAA
ncbi:trypsin-like serine peptidase [Amycolatopsis nigrescens]|uniref:trypsin-like serine peptidase n=1 Tax=Amycolatopsis nigrescens TaxID=381445 RepID=UPI0003A8752E|nr:peptidase [Amycolatopsis nigrescens]